MASHDTYLIDGKCPCCANPWQAATAGFFCQICDETKKEDEKSTAVRGLDRSNMDFTVDPKDNFYTYSNGNWMKNNPIPSGYSSWNTFQVLRLKSQEDCKLVLEELEKKDVEGEAKKLKLFYSSALDEEKIEEVGVAPMKPLLDLCQEAVDNKEDKVAFAASLGKLALHFGVHCFFGIGAGPDKKNSDHSIAQVGQGGLKLPDRDYYFDEDKEEKRCAYKETMALMLTLLEDLGATSPTDEAVATAEKVFNLEKTLAEAHMTKTENRDPHDTYNKMSIEDMSKMCGDTFDFASYFEAATGGMTSDKIGDINLRNIKALQKVAEVAPSVEADVLLAYFRWHAVCTFAPYLSSPFVNAHFEFYEKALQGTDKLKPRWKRAIEFTEGALGEAVGQLYCKTYFDESSKGRALAIVEQVRQALEDRLKEVDWMKSEETRANALKKMSKFGVKIGYPDKWLDYSTLEITEGDDFLTMKFKSNEFANREEIKEINAPTDKAKWFMTPQTVNAYYHPSLNEIVFPAAILQHPFFDKDADDAVNFGSMGAVIGHEMTHGFDDKGRKFDYEGNMVDWWTEEDAKEYERRVEVMVEQADQFLVHDQAVKGKLTSGENIADLGGLRLALRGLVNSKDYDPNSKIDGFTPLQRFFLSWSQCWRQNVTEQRALQLITLDPHGPNELRCNGPLSNMPEFHEAFGVKEGDRMYKQVESRVDICSPVLSSCSLSVPLSLLLSFRGATMTMKLWTLAEISDELANAPQISSTPNNNLITLNNKTLCHLPLIFPFNNKDGTPFKELNSVEGFASVALAAQHLNTGDGSIVPEVAALANNSCGIKFNVAAFDTELSESTAVDQIIKLTDRTNDVQFDVNNLLLRPPCTILGAARSAVSMPLSIISGLRGFPQISPISTSPALDDKSQYKYFARTIPNDDGTSIPLIAKLNSGSGSGDESGSWGVNFLAVIHVDDAYGSAFAQGIRLAAQEMAPGMKVETYSLSTNADDAQVERKIASMAASKFMYFFGILTPSSLVDSVMTAAVNAGIAGTGRHTWLFSDSVGSGITGRNFTKGSALERAYRGTGLLAAQGGISGMKTYDALEAAIRELAESPEDKEYLNSLLPKYHSSGDVNNYTEITSSDSYLTTSGVVGPFLYDAVIAAGLSACNLKMNHSATAGDFALSGEEHFKAIVTSTFQGSSGPVLFNNKTGTRNPRSALFSLINFVDDPDASTSTVVQFKSQATDLFESGVWKNLQPYVFSSGDTIIPSDLPETDVNHNYIPTGLRVVGLFLCSVIIALSVGFSAWTKRHEKMHVVKAAQPIFLYIITFGTFLMGCSIIPLSLDPGAVSMEGASIACTSTPWLLACGFSMTFSALFTKTHRILTIMRNAAAFKRVKVTALDVAKPMIFLLFANVITLTVWTAIDPMRSETIILEENRLGQPTETESICTSEHRSIFLTVLGIINLGALLVAFVEAYLARKISVELSESAYIMKAISIILLVSCMGIPIIIIAQDNTSAFYFVAVGIMFVICISILCLIFIPKIRASRKKQKQKRRSSLSIRGISRTSETEESGIKILSTPKAMEDLEEENRKLKELVFTASGRRLSATPSNLADGSGRLSPLSNDSIAESEADPKKRVVFDSSKNCEIENEAVVDPVDEEGVGDVREESKVDNVVVVSLASEGGTNTSETENHSGMKVPEVAVDDGGIDDEKNDDIQVNGAEERMESAL